ncbi:MAG: hypothetical protein F4X62_06530 [Caldilineaceae bacterium SB0662_bin_25]|nr:hypothetical protein [Caldilineaceae bacterium SB0662_bin_25]
MFLAAPDCTVAGVVVGRVVVGVVVVGVVTVSVVVVGVVVVAVVAIGVVAVDVAAACVTSYVGSRIRIDRIIRIDNNDNFPEIVRQVTCGRDRGRWGSRGRLRGRWRWQSGGGRRQSRRRRGIAVGVVAVACGCRCRIGHVGSRIRIGRIVFIDNNDDFPEIGREVTCGRDRGSSRRRGSRCEGWEQVT